MGHNRFVVGALGEGSSVSIVFQLSPQIPELDLGDLTNHPLQGRGTRSTTLSLRMGPQRAKGLVDCLELVLGIEVLGVGLSLRVTSHLRMKGRAGRRSTGMTLNG